MKRFYFSLEKVLEIRNIRRVMAEDDLGRAARQFQMSQALLKDSQQAMAKNLSDTKQVLSGVLDLCLVRDFMVYRYELKEQIKKRSEDAKNCEKQVNRARNELVERMRESKALQNLKDRQYRQYKIVYWKEQGKILDEMASVRYYRRKKGGE